jgi:hypothetical protein
MGKNTTEFFLFVIPHRTNCRCELRCLYSTKIRKERSKSKYGYLTSFICHCVVDWVNSHTPEDMDSQKQGYWDLKSAN